MEEASGLGIAGSTALSLLSAAKLRQGNSVLVNGASGGVGHLVLQLCCRSVGSTGKVVAVCSSCNVDWVEKLVATNTVAKDVSGFEFVTYDSHAPVHEYLVQKFGAARFDAIIDAAGIQSVFINSPPFLKEGKPYVTVGPLARSYTYAGMLTVISVMAKNMFWPKWLGGTPRPYVQVAAVPNAAALEELAKMVGEGVLRVHVGKLMKTSEVQKASNALTQYRKHV
jgi:NADPH:quinone reductase-like Zn-dependent oxidoreductase